MLKRMGLKWAVSLVLAAGVALPVLASETPDTLAGVKVVKAAEVKKMLDAGTPVIDTRVAAEYAEKSIKGAKSVPYKEKSAKAVGFDATQDQFDLSKLPADKAAPIVFFCNAGECWKSFKASVVAQKAGYSKISWFRGGMPEWSAAGLATQ
jgi:rhodanese-related sulfurtransferase